LLRRGRGRLLSAYVSGRRMGHEQGREEAKQTNNDSQYPGTFFQYVGRLLYTHELVAETADIGSQTAAFGVLHQDDKAQEHTSHNDQ